MPYVLDANVMNLFQKERMEDVKGVAHSAIDVLLASCCIALDDGDLCQQEWIECAGGDFPFALTDWISDMIVAQHIKLFPLCNDNMHKELSNLGIPKKDHKWIRLAIGSKSPIIVTDDIDLFDPSKKNYNSSAKDKIKSCRGGPIPKYLKKKYKIDVMCSSHVKDFMNI